MEIIQKQQYPVLVMGTGTAETVADSIRRLRKRSGLKMDELAIAVGLSGRSSLQHYLSSDTFRKKYLPLDMAEKMAAVLVGRGSPPITRDEVLALAGAVGKSAAAGNPAVFLDCLLLGKIIKAIETVVEEDELPLTPDKKGYHAARMYQKAILSSKPNLRDDSVLLSFVQDELLNKSSLP